jgi:hypothetical protein
MAFRILSSERVQRILQALSPRFIGRDQDHLLALADEAADAGYSAAYDYVQPLYDFRDTLVSPAGASEIGIADTGGHYTSDNVEGALQEAAVLAATYPVISVFGRTGAITANTGDYTFAKIGSTPTTLGGYGITDAVSVSTYTPTDILTKIKTVDGTGSGLDAGLLEGQNGAFYRAWANFTGTPTTQSGYGITDGAAASTQIIAGNGLTGGGSLATDRTISMGTPSTITGATANSVTSGSHTHSFTLTEAQLNSLLGIQVGYKNIPLTTKNSNYVFTAADAGNGFMHTDASARTWTVPSSVFNAGDVITVVNFDTANIVLSQGSGMSLFMAGTTGATSGSRTVGPRGVATILFINTGAAFVSGAGVS